AEIDRGKIAAAVHGFGNSTATVREIGIGSNVRTRCHERDVVCGVVEIHLHAALDKLQHGAGGGVLEKDIHRNLVTRIDDVAVRNEYDVEFGARLAGVGGRHKQSGQANSPVSPANQSTDPTGRHVSEGSRKSARVGAGRGVVIHGSLKRF